jgi:hypothetical protein
MSDKEDVMDRGFGWRVSVAAVMVAAAVAVGMYGYNLGMARGVAESSRVMTTPGAGVPVVAMWPHPWGFGFGFFPVFPLFFIVFWLFVARGLFWRGGWRRGGGYHGVPPAFEEWHRRAHARQEPPSQTNA